MNTMLIKRNSKMCAALLNPGFPVAANHLCFAIQGLKSCRFHEPQTADVGLEIPAVPCRSCFADHLEKVCSKTPASALGNDPPGVKSRSWSGHLLAALLLALFAP